MELFKPVAKTIASCLSEGGTMISIERFPQIIETYGYVKALCNYGVDVMINKYKQIWFRVVGDRESMPFIIGSIGNPDITSIDNRFNEELDRIEREYYLTK